MFILEELEFARARGAEPLAEVLGYAATSDAVHVAAPDAEGTGAAQCMTLAMRRAGVTPEQISYINPHGTGTPAGDLAETQAIKRAYGDHATRGNRRQQANDRPPDGRSGAMEAAICVQVLRTGIIPPTINLHTPDPLRSRLCAQPGASREGGGGDVQFVWPGRPQCDSCAAGLA